MNRNIVFIHGYDNSASQPHDYPPVLWKACADRGANVFHLGDGLKEINFAEVKISIESAFSNRLPTTLVFDAHDWGAAKRHELIWGRGEDTKTREVFKFCSQASQGVEFDILLLTCQAGKALRHVDLLPTGTMVSFTCDSRGRSYYYDHMGLGEALANPDFGKSRELTATNLLLFFLVSAWYSERPVLAQSGGVNVDSKKYLRQPLERNTLYASAEGLRDLIPEEEALPVLERLSKPDYRGGSSLRSPYRGKALAIMMNAGLMMRP